MQVRNPYSGTTPLQCLCITTTGEKFNMSCISKPLVEVRDDVTEMIVKWEGPGYNHSKVWTLAKGWLEVAEYQERKRFEEEKAKFEEQRVRSRRKPQKETHENDSPPSDNLRTDPS